MRDREYRRNRRRRRNYFYRSYYYLSDCYTNALARWKSDMPKCFKVVFLIAACLLIFSIGVNLSLKVGLISQEYVPVWWLKLSPYLIGSSGGISFLAKFTRDNKTVDEAIDSVTKKINDNQYPDK